MPQPIISIVTISFNQAAFIRETVESVIRQKSSDVEYIVVDAGSTDGSRDILLSYGSAIDHLIFEPDQGPADGLNKGFARASGTIGYFLNADDFLLPKAISVMRNIWRDRAESDVLLCGGWMVDHHGDAVRELRATPVSLQNLAAGHAIIFQQGMSFRLESFRRAGGFNVSNRSCWDRELLCAMMATGSRVALSTTRLATFRIHSGGLSGGVGGNAAMLRHESDQDRILKLYAPQKRAGNTFRNKSIRRFIKLVMSPLWTARLLGDAAFPVRRLRRFQSDCGR
jgi:glycosyltransferase involved in cell wall biosynthesis